MSKPEMRSDRLREELAEMTRQRDELRAALKQIVALDNDQHPGLHTWNEMRKAAHRRAVALTSTEAP